MLTESVSGNGLEGPLPYDLDPANLRTATVNRDSARRFLRLTFGMSP